MASAQHFRQSNQQSNAKQNTEVHLHGSPGVEEGGMWGALVDALLKQPLRCSVVALVGLQICYTLQQHTSSLTDSSACKAQLKKKPGVA